MPISKVGSKGIKDAELSAADIAPGTITSDKIAPGTIANDRLAGSIANAKLANSSVTLNGTAVSLGGTASIGTQWQAVKTSSFTAVAGEGYFVNTTSSAITVTLPGSPSVGDTVILKDYARTWATNNVTIASALLDGANTTALFDTNGETVTLVYMDGTKGWSVVNEDTTNALELPTNYTAATGGTVTTSGDYKIHTFNSSSNFVISSVGNSPANPNAGPAVVDYVVVAGGGGGGMNHAGGGGAGGYRESHSTCNSGPYTASPLATPTGITVTATTYPITVGAGGSSAPSPSGQTGGNGSNSVFSTITSTGGGGGNWGPQPSAPGNPGGSGGAGGSQANSGGNGNTPPVSPPQGNNGGNGTSWPDPGYQGGGGGGGAGAAGNTPSGSTGGAGGAGVASSITGSPVTRAGGGGAGGHGSHAFIPGAGGAGGGGKGATGPGSNPSNSPSELGSANTGGGGGAGQPGGGIGQAGGSGVVIIRYQYQN